MAENQSQSNAAEAAPATPGTGLFTVDFSNNQMFQDLDKKVTGKKNPEEVKKEEISEPTKELKETQEKLGASSKEAKKLKANLDDYQKYDKVMPIIKQLYDDPSLVEHVKSYYATGGQTSSNIKEQLKLPEDFIFDPEEAFTDPKSDSYRVVMGTIGSAIRNEMQGLQSKIADTDDENRAYTEELDFKRQNNISDEDFNDFKSWAKETKSTRENAWKWYNIDKKKTNIVNNEVTEQLDQAIKMQNTYNSAGNLGAEGSAKKPIEDRLFDSIQAAMVDQDTILKFDK